MTSTPILSPAVPRIHPPGLHVRTPSRSPTRNRYIDDILSDLTPVTTLEAFKSPSGRLKTSIEVATDSERAFGLRAALASKNIQEWVDELSNWSWPVEGGGGSLGFEVPHAKRRKLSHSTTSADRDASSGQDGEKNEPEYIGSLLATEVQRYELRLDEIHADMEELNVEEIKRQVLDTHFSAKSRPSTPTSASPMPSSLSSYARMDDFTAIVTATVLKSLPNLSKLMRLMDVWSIRLTVLRKVPPLLLALEDAEIALKSGWNSVNDPGKTNGGDVALSRDSFGVMRAVLQDKVTTLGQDLDFMLDTLEGREDTLPDSWLDRMEAIEQDYGEWAVSADRKVREGEWASMARARREAEEARRVKEEAAARAAEEAERARLKAQREEDEARAAEHARRKAEEAAEEAERVRLQGLRDAEDASNAEIAKQQAQKEAEEALAAETARREADILEISRRKALLDAEDAKNVEITRLAAEEAKTAKRKAEVAELARLQALKETQDAELARQKAEAEAEEALAAEHARQQAEKAELARGVTLKGIEDALAAEIAREQAQKEADEAEAAEVAKRQAEKDAEAAELVRLQSIKDAEDAQRVKEAEEAKLALQQAQKEAEFAELARVRFLKHTELAQKAAQEKEAAEAAECVAREAELARQQAQKEADEAEATKLQALKDFEAAEVKNQKAQKELGDAEDTEATIHSAIEHAAPQRKADIDSLDSKETEATNQDVQSAPPEALLATEVFKGQGLAEKESSLPISRLAPFDGNYSEDSGQPLFSTSSISIAEQPTEEFFPEAASLASQAQFSVPEHHSSSRPITPNLALSPISQPATGSPRSPKSPRFAHAVTNLIQRAPSPKFFNRPTSSSSSKSMEMEDTMRPREAGYVPHSPSKVSSSPFEYSQGVSQRESRDWIVVDSSENPNLESSPVQPTQSSGSETDPRPERERSVSKRHSRNISVVTRYATSDPTPEIQEAGPAEYFRPVLSPSNTARSPADITEPSTPSRSLFILSGPTKAGRTIAILDGSDGGDGCEACEEAGARTSARDTASHVFVPEPSSTETKEESEAIPIRSRRGSNTSDTVTAFTADESAVEASSSPIASPMSPKFPLEAFPEADESPTANRIGLRTGNKFDYSPPDSPPPGQAVSKLRSLTLQQEPTFSLDSTAPLTPLEPPVLDEVDVSPHLQSSPKKARSEDQLQQQISNLLESIPARIRLTSEPESTPFSPFSPNTLHPKKTRRSLTPMRSSSSMSNYSTSSYARAPTPSFTLAPAFSKTNHRSRTPGNPEIKLYHLSRSTGEAPIKLFVRLVGEHGERVMVRVGGGWADLGEYLKEYASHHGRRTAADNDRVEIQDLPPRMVSSGSAYSTTTLRNSGRDSPAPGSVSRPQSVLDRPIDRPGSSLNIRKTRKSVGESSEYFSRSGMANDIRAPSTPLPSINRLSYETPPSAAPSEASSGSTGPSHRSSSRLSWTEEDSSLGLAGPKSKKVVISEKDQEWVESMKEKVRLASAEKEKRNREREVRESGVGGKNGLGEMDRVGGTKRLFRKSGV